MFALKRKIRRLENMRSLWERIEEIFNNDLSNLSDQCTAFSNLKDGIKIYLVRPCPRPLSIGHFINFDAIQSSCNENKWKGENKKQGWRLLGIFWFRLYGYRKIKTSYKKKASE